MSTPRDWARLQRAADEVTVQSSVRASGISSTIWGVVNAAAGFLANDLILFALGLALLAVGVWKWSRPSVGGLLASAIAMAVIGVWNIVTTALAPAGGVGMFVMLGVVQVGWAVRYAAQWRRFSRGDASEAAEAERLEVQAMLKGLRGANLKQAPDVIHFSTTAYPPMACRARLMDDGVLCLVGNGDDVRLLRPEQFTIEAKGKPGLLGGRSVRVRLAERDLGASLAKDQWERYESWRARRAA